MAVSFRSKRLRRFKVLRVPSRVVERVPDKEFLRHFAPLQDPRVDRTKEHLLIDIVVIAVLAVLGGADGWTAIATYGMAKQRWLEQFLALPNGIPSHDTFARLFARLDPEMVGACFMSWMSEVVEGLGAQVIAIDGKCLRGSYDRDKGRKALHLVSAFATQNRIVLAQAKVMNKSNEITAIPKVLALLDLVGSIVTLDAMGCQRDIASQIIDQKGDYILSLKGNQGNLHNSIQDAFKTAQVKQFTDIEHDFYRTLEIGHHRIESRQCWVIPITALVDIPYFKAWSGLQSVVMIRSQRKLWNKTTHEDRLYITSLPPQAQKILQAIRSHWGIENQLHWVMDVTFNEDASRIRKDHAPENFALLRRMANHLLLQEKTFKGSLKMKRYQAGLDNDYMITILSTLDLQIPSEVCQNNLSSEIQN